MKNKVSLLLTLALLFSLCACSRENDKEKLIGTYSTHIESRDLATNGFISAINQTRTISFSANNTFYYETTGASGQFTKQGVALYIMDLSYSGSGTYSVKNGFITLKYDKDSDIWKHFPIGWLDPIPYRINETTQTVLFDVKKDGTSDWVKTSSTPLSK